MLLLTMNKNDFVIFQKGDFMKKQLTVALGLAVLATPAFATKARLQALREDIYGSYYINDNRNIWLNPAQITNHKDLVTFEWGDASGSGAALGARGVWGRAPRKRRRACRMFLRRRCSSGT